MVGLQKYLIKKKNEDSLIEQFANIIDIDKKLQYLAKIADSEYWGKKLDGFPEDYSILFNYLGNTFARVFREEKIEITEGESQAIFNTGLLTSNDEEIYCHFEKNFKSESF